MDDRLEGNLVYVKGIVKVVQLVDLLLLLLVIVSAYLSVKDVVFQQVFEEHLKEIRRVVAMVINSYEHPLNCSFAKQVEDG